MAANHVGLQRYTMDCTSNVSLNYHNFKLSCLYKYICFISKAYRPNVVKVLTGNFNKNGPLVAESYFFHQDNLHLKRKSLACSEHDG